MAHDELIRMYTPEGEFTDNFRRRGDVHRDGEWHGTVHLWVMNSSAELLFQKRADTAELNPGLWDVSAAGHIVNDDSPELSLEREALEELGITIAAKEVKWLFRLKTESYNGTLHERVFQHVYLIHRNIDLAELKLQVEEVAGVEWHHCSILEKLRKDSTGFVPRTEEYARLLDYLDNQRKP